MVAVVGKEESKVNPAFMVVCNGGKVKKVLSSDDTFQEGFVSMSDSLFLTMSEKKNQRVIGGVNKDAGGDWIVTGDYCDIDNMTVIKNVTKTVSEDELCLFENITSKKYKAGAFFTMNQADFYTYGTWYDTLEEMKEGEK